MRSLLPLITNAGVLLSLLSATLPLQVSAKKDGPEITSTTFDSPLENIFYFDDSNVILGHDREASTVYRSDDAGSKWSPVKGDGLEGHSWDLWPHPFDNKRAYIIGDADIHWMTKDQGKTWKKFSPGSEANYERSAPLSFHGRDPSKVIWNGLNCLGLSCDEVASYTDDDFASTSKLGTGTRGCYWAVGTKMFGEAIASEVEDRIFCVKEGLYSPWLKDNRLVVSDDHFKSEEVEPALDGDRAVTGIISMAAVKGYIVAAAKSEGTDELALYVSDDSSTWHRAIFGQHRVTEGAYTILESTNYSMQVDVMGSRPMNPMGFLFTSNSNGTYFTKNIDYTNRSPFGRVDFEKVANIQGIVLVNVVDNHEEVERSTLADKQIISQISFDDGRTFQDLLVGDKKLHLHSVTDAKQSGRMFSSPAPGIVMGVGNTGKFLKAYEDGDLYVSDDAGVTWREGLDGAHLYEFGNKGAVLVAVDDEEATSHIQYSLDHGKTWTKASLEKKIRARYLTTVPDSTTLSFLLGGTSGSGSKSESLIYKIDFEGLHERVCTDKDFEKWPARVDDKGKPSCIMGHKQFYRRRKADAECVIEGEFEDPVPEFEPCICTEADFECDFNFVRDPKDRSKCLPTSPMQIPDGACKKAGDTFKGSSGWRLIPGNECTRKGGVELDKDIERECSDTAKKPSSDQVEAEKTKFKADLFAEWYYLERSDTSTGTDETIIMRTSEQEIFMTRDHGKTWEPILKGEPITAIMPNPHQHDAVYFLTGGKTVHYTIDRGDTFHTFDAQERPSTNGYPVLKFHPDYKDWMLWAGHPGKESHTNIYYSKDRGDHWQTLARFAKKCDFMYREEKDALIYCLQYEEENPSKRLQLLSSETFFASTDLKFVNILDYATMAEFIIVAARTEDQQSLQVDASVDGVQFAQAEFPKNFQVAHQQAYTVLDSSTHAVFLHVTVNNVNDQEYGTIIKSNSNGTSYVLTLDNVNRNTDGFVDFEKMLGLEGVAMVNVVANEKQVSNGEKKKLKSMITHNDGAHWSWLPPPKVDARGKNYDCVSTANVATDKCALHIHSYTERMDKSATFSSPSSVGLMMAVGNVGEFLDRKDSEATDTFITRDAGITWKSVMKGSFMWEYGDQGSIIVIVRESSLTTKSVFYSLDEGETWTEYEFSDIEMRIDAITTVPSDTSRNFLLWGRETGNGAKSSEIVTVNLDFSGLKSRQRQCKLDESKPVNEDYELWEPKHPSQQDNCLFGHVAQYHRKKVDADCYNGRTIDHLHSIVRNCTCSRQDFECDYNFQMFGDGTCQLVPGLSPPDHKLNCEANPKTIEFHYSTGYRKIPLSTCEGGQDLEYSDPQPCPGHEDEFQRKHGLGGAGLFFAIVIPIIAAGGIGYWVWKTYQERGFGGFGAIRLGESLGASTSSGGGSGQSPLITIPVTLIAGVVAVAKALPLLASSLFRSAKGYVPVGSGGRQGSYSGGPYRSRDSFANRRGEFADQAYAEDDELFGGEDDADAEEV